MAQFVLVANGVSNVDFERALAIANNPASKVTFTPQPVQAPPATPGVSSPGLTSVPTQPQPGAAHVLNGVRFEWDSTSYVLGAQIVNALAGHDEAH
jgi:hypothetical protein